jgi:hypothetical protein
MPVGQTLLLGMMEYLVNNELEIMWKEASWPSIRHCPYVCLEKLRTTEYLSG